MRVVVMRVRRALVRSLGMRTVIAAVLVRGGRGARVVVGRTARVLVRGATRRSGVAARFLLLAAFVVVVVGEGTRREAKARRRDHQGRDAKPFHFRALLLT